MPFVTDKAEPPKVSASKKVPDTPPKICAAVRPVKGTLADHWIWEVDAGNMVNCTQELLVGTRD